jgi:hypothetical protein
MADNEFNKTKTYGFALDTRRTKLSNIRSGRWAFFDPNSLNWQDANDKVSYAIIADRQVGIVTADKTSPEQYVELLEVGDTIVRSTNNGVFVFYKLPEGAKL